MTENCVSATKNLGQGRNFMGEKQKITATDPMVKQKIDEYWKCVEKAEIIINCFKKNIPFPFKVDRSLLLFTAKFAETRQCVERDEIWKAYYALPDKEKYYVR